MTQGIPAAQKGQIVDLRAQPGTVSSMSMTDPHDELWVHGIIPNAADGARVIFGAGLRIPELQGLPLTVNAALMTPEEATQIAHVLLELAAQAATACAVGVTRPPWLR